MAVGHLYTELRYRCPANPVRCCLPGIPHATSRGRETTSYFSQMRCLLPSIAFASCAANSSSHL